MPTAHAGTKELDALKAALTVDISQATSEQLYDAFKTVISSAPFNTVSKYGVVVGEALKAAGPNASDAGEYFGENIPTDTTPAVATAYSAKNALIAFAASTAATGKVINVSQIPDLTAGLLDDAADPKSAATLAAETAKNKNGSSAILGGAAQLLADDAERTTFANDSLLNKKLKSYSQEIVQWITTAVDDSPSFAVNVANANLNFKIAVKVATGAAAGDPTNAGNIVRNLYNQQLMDPTTGADVAPTETASVDVLSTLNKGAATLAKSVATVADIEEIQKIANAFGKQMAKSNGATVHE
jgi:hypothetical protein